jgi:multidrug efflux pump subunit AcrB
VVAIYLALVFQFKNAIKPFIVFAAIPYGMVGALLAATPCTSPSSTPASCVCVPC